MASCIVRCRGSLPRRIALSTAKRWSSRWASSATPMACARAAASSMASGMPSRRRQISTTSGAVRLVEHEGRIRGPGAGHEQRHRGDLGRLVGRDRRADAVLESGRQRLHRPHLLARHGEGLSAGGDDGDGGCLAQDAGHELGHRLDEVLAVVEHQQAVTRAEQLDDRVVDRARPAQVHVDGRREGRGGGVLVDHADQLDHVDAVRVATADARASSRPSDVLPTPPGAHQRHQPVVGERLGELRERALRGR